jgi:hypothetical protein
MSETRLIHIFFRIKGLTMRERHLHEKDPMKQKDNLLQIVPTRGRQRQYTTPLVVGKIQK